MFFLLLNCFANSQTLIRDSCKKAAAKDQNMKYDFCVKSLESNPHSKSATCIKGLVIASTKNAAFNTINVERIAKTILVEKKTSPEFVKIYSQKSRKQNLRLEMRPLFCVKRF
ncbi:unnamed protein product, partial [Thlaspi arvense]